ncbi:MAG: bifunctional indole-3-glycerol phosphate synthase/phosphoribosylanthranilate isomerase [Bacteroidetes bacterium]|nr:bifunctional indole-3-glycerol phosphate synthase/phosphoribosylanthranilate isomerase [Bacteroidota bacterium]
MNILQKIQQERVVYKAQETGEILNMFPKGLRSVPVVDFFGKKGLICELKKASPSKGIINFSEPLEDVIIEYIQGGAERFSVLTEQNHFLGNWRFLQELKSQHPEKGFLRKDFLYTKKDIYESWLIGADAVLLIAEMLDTVQIALLIAEAHNIGLQVLCEAHSDSELERVLNLEELPDAIGINSRNLVTFQVNNRVPFALKQRIPETIPVIAESGVRDAFFTRLAGNAGFHGVLIGETLMRSENRTLTVQEMLSEYEKGRAESPNFFSRLMKRCNRMPGMRHMPLVKICGITKTIDAEIAVGEGADVLGFILAPSKRQINLSDLEKFAKYDVLKVAVVKDPDKVQVRALRELLVKGTIDGVQLHGNESLKLMQSFGGNAYKAISLDSPEAVDGDYFAPLSLYDKPKDTLNDSLGLSFDSTFREVLQGGFIAGGISPQNLGSVLEMCNPLLIDIASGVEVSPGVKDHGKIREIFSILESFNG